MSGHGHDSGAGVLRRLRDAECALLIAGMYGVVPGSIVGILGGLPFWGFGAIFGVLAGVPTGFVAGTFGAAIGGRNGFKIAGAAAGLLGGYVLERTVPVIVVPGLISGIAAVGGLIAGGLIDRDFGGGEGRPGGMFRGLRDAAEGLGLYGLPFWLRLLLAAGNVLAAWALAVELFGPR